MKLWTPDKYEAKKAKEILKLNFLNDYDKNVMEAIVHAHQIGGCLNISDKDILIHLEELYINKI